MVGQRRCETPKLPKLKVKTFPGYSTEEVRDFEQAKDLPFSYFFIFLEGQRVNSYEDFLQLAAQDSYKDKEFLDVMVLASGLVDGG